MLPNSSHLVTNSISERAICETLLAVYQDTVNKLQTLSMVHNAMFADLDGADSTKVEQVLAWCRQPIEVPTALPKPSDDDGVSVIRWAIADCDRVVKATDAKLRAFEAEKLLEQLS